MASVASKPIMLSVIVLNVVMLSVVAPLPGPTLCGLYYKTTMIVIMMIVSDATIWSVTYDRN
jgi:hypothetical protein